MLIERLNGVVFSETMSAMYEVDGGSTDMRFVLFAALLLFVACLALLLQRKSIVALYMNAGMVDCPLFFFDS
jgi:hypothetical protein